MIMEMDGLVVVETGVYLSGRQGFHTISTGTPPLRKEFVPAGEVRDVLMTATYAVVLFSVFVQGPTLAAVAKRLNR